MACHAVTVCGNRGWPLDSSEFSSLLFLSPQPGESPVPGHPRTHGLPSPLFVPPAAAFYLGACDLTKTLGLRGKCVVGKSLEQAAPSSEAHHGLSHG